MGMVIALLGVCVTLGIVAIVALCGRGEGGIVSLTLRKVTSRIKVLEQKADKPCSDCTALREEMVRLRARLEVIETTGLNSVQWAQFIELQQHVNDLTNEVRRLRWRRPLLMIRRNVKITQVLDERGGFSWLYVLLFATIGLIVGAFGSAAFNTSRVDAYGVTYVVGSFVNEPTFVIVWGFLGALIGGFLGFIPSRRSRRRG